MPNMSVTSVNEARQALRRGAPAELVGLRECVWLDVKSGPYRLTSPEGKEELVKDVAAFANAPTGGLLLVGYQTDVRDGEEIVSGVGPIPRALVDLDQHRKLIRSRVMPPPRDLDLSWIDCGEERGILVIDIPRQPSSMLPFVVPGPSGKDKASEYSLAVPVREADATHWLPQPEIRRLLALGWAASDGPSDEVLSALVAKAVSAANSATEPTRPSYEVGAGVPGWKHQFREVYDQVRQQTPLGNPLTEVYRDGPGVVQRIEPTGSSDGWLLCALPGRRPIVVAESVWEALHTAGSGVPDGDVLSALGFPIIDQPDAPSAQVINEEVAVVALSGGGWGNGRLLRVDGDQLWSWEPVPGFSLDMTRAARNWTGGATSPQLRVRAIATLPWAWAGGRQISTARRQKLADNLPISHLAGALTVLSQRRGADLRAARWNPGPNRNGLDAASYSTAIMAPDSARPALSGEVMIALPNSTSSAVVTCAELRVDDVAAWADALRTADGPADLDLRLPLEELIEFFSVAWTTTTEVLPTLIDPDPYGGLWAAPPTVELRLSTEHQQGSAEPLPQLSELVDFTSFGARADDRLTEMAVTITAPPRLVPAARRDLTCRALVHMGQAFGFLDAALDRL
jgi:hypothetical protein